MAKVTFYEKPGCAGNARQKAWLVQSGHEVEARSLLAAAWTPEDLRSYFGARPVVEWFNCAARQVNSGEVRPEELDAEMALAMLVADPLLIRRPLIEVEGRRVAGFDAYMIGAWIGLAAREAPVTEDCVRPSLKTLA